MKSKAIILAVTAFITLGSQVTNAADRVLILGRSKIVVPHGAIVGTQVDRVIRDIAWKDSAFDERVDPQRIPKNSNELVPYMEGRLSGLLMQYAGAKVEGLGPTEAIQSNGQYLADDGNGKFRFAIDPSKTEYRTAKNLGSGKFVFPDSHGFSMVAGSAIRRSKTEALHTVIACMDLPAKAEAALYLADNGINTYGPCDRAGWMLIGYREKHPKAATIMGTAPIRQLQGGAAVIGDQEITIKLDETVVVENTVDQKYPFQYNDTPHRYFTTLDKKYSLKMKLVTAQANPGEAAKVVEKAESIGAKVIAVRLWDENDAKAVSAWLEKNSGNRAVLFHTAIYYPGYALFAKFPKQTSFGDLSPVIN